MDVQGIITLIQSTLNPEAPVLLSKGEVIADKVNSELDELRELFVRVRITWTKCWKGKVNAHKSPP